MKSLTTFAALFLLGLLALHAEARPDPEANEPAASTTADQDHIIFGGGIFGQSGDGTADENLSPAASVGMADAANGWLNGPAAAIEGNGPAASEDKANAQNSVAATDCFGTEANAPCTENLGRASASTTAEDNQAPLTSEGKANAQNSVAATDCFGTEANAPCAQNLWDTDGPATSEDKANAQNSVEATDCSGNGAGAPCAQNLWDTDGPATSEDKANAQNSVEATDCLGNGAGAPCAENLWMADKEAYVPATSEDKANAQNSAVAENIWFGPTTATENYPGPYDSEDKSTATYFNFGDVRSNAGPPCAETDKADCMTYAPKVTHMRPVYSRCGYFGITHGDCKALQCDWLPSPIGDCWAVKHEFPPT